VILTPHAQSFPRSIDVRSSWLSIDVLVPKCAVELLGVPSRRYIPYHRRFTMSASIFNTLTGLLTVVVDMVVAEFVWVGNELRLTYAMNDPEPYTEIHDIADRKCFVCCPVLGICGRRLRCQ
jgi:hypothetical protein